MLDELDSLFERLLLSNPDQLEPSVRLERYRNLSLQNAVAAVRATDFEVTRRSFELRLRLALHLAPRRAIAYDAANPTPRWRLVREYLIKTLDRSDPAATALAREIADVLDHWDARRMAVGNFRRVLMRRQADRCAHCRVDFRAIAEVRERRDVYKPYYESPEELLAPEVDHVAAISRLGSNQASNLQVLCRLCNQGKGDGLGISVSTEAGYAGMSAADVSVRHRAAMIFAVIERDARVCLSCGDVATELTIRPMTDLGGYVRSNLMTICYTCVD